MPRAVLLQHDLPDGSFHYDWMIQRPGGADRPLLTLRVTDRIDQGSALSFAAELLGEHRAAYLDYEGPVSRDRGNVRCLATGEMTIEEETERRLVVAGRLGGASGHFEGLRIDEGAWRFTFTPG